MAKSLLDPKHSPDSEYCRQKRLIQFLRDRDWWVHVNHASAVNFGLPDLVIGHAKFKMRWVEVKHPVKYSFTTAQQDVFPTMSRFTGIWVLHDGTEGEYQKLFGPPNWSAYNLRFQGFKELPK